MEPKYKPLIESKITKLFEDYEFVAPFPILLGKLHPTVHEEFIAETRRLEKQVFDPELGTLKYHLNVGQNLGQASIPKHRLGDGFSLHYITALAAYFMWKMGSVESFADAYSQGRLVMSTHPMNIESAWWINWADKTSINEKHQHPTSLTSVLYIENSHLAKTCFYMDDIVYKHQPEDGEIVLFPGWLNHSVEPIQEDGVRVTAACNLNYYNYGAQYIDNVQDYQKIY